MTPWEEVVAATDKHNLSEVLVRIGDGESWTYYQCSCYPETETFREAWEFTDHIRRVVFDALSDRLAS